MASEEIIHSCRAIDLSGLQRLAEGDKAMELKYINNFLISVPEQINISKRAIAACDITMLNSTLHLLKPQMLFYGLKDVFELIKNLESQLEQDKVISPAVMDASDLIYKEIKSACAQLEQIKSHYTDTHEQT